MLTPFAKVGDEILVGERERFPEKCHGIHSILK